MKPCFKYIVSGVLLVLLTAYTTHGQDSLVVAAKDSTQQISTPTDSLPTTAADTTTVWSNSTQPPLNNKAIGGYLGIDYGKLLTSAFQLERKYELNAGLRFAQHFVLTADVGYADLAPPNAIKNGQYNAKGMYYRAGADYRFEIFPKTFLSLGAMYAISQFKDEGTVEIQSEVWPSFTQQFERTNLTAQWVEAVVTSQAPILPNKAGILSHFYWGIKFRLRFMINRPQPENFDIYAIPGYGRTFNTTVPAANLFLTFSF